MVDETQGEGGHQTRRVAASALLSPAEIQQGMQIFKMQIPLFSTDNNAKALVYNKAQNIGFEILLTPEMANSLFGNFPERKYKVFVKAIPVRNHRKKETTLKIRAIVPDQDW